MLAGCPGLGNTRALLEGYGTSQVGDCDVSKSPNLWLHLTTIVLPTRLLLGSSGFMTAATALSREEIDLAVKSTNSSAEAC
jgi:hypothetical protein